MNEITDVRPTEITAAEFVSEGYAAKIAAGECAVTVKGDIFTIRHISTIQNITGSMSYVPVFHSGFSFHVTEDKKLTVNWQPTPAQAGSAATGEAVRMSNEALATGLADESVQMEIASYEAVKRQQVIEGAERLDLPVEAVEAWEESVNTPPVIPSFLANMSEEARQEFTRLYNENPTNTIPLNALTAEQRAKNKLSFTEEYLRLAKLENDRLRSVLEAKVAEADALRVALGKLRDAGESMIPALEVLQIYERHSYNEPQTISDCIQHLQDSVKVLHAYDDKAATEQPARADASGEG